MKSFIYVLPFLFFTQHTSASSVENEMWWRCENDSDCVLADDICGGFTAINKKFCDKYYQWLKKRN